MTVAEFIELLKKQPQDLQVAYAKYSEQCLVEYGDLCIVGGCEPRPDGWIQNPRPDKPLQAYLLLPGN